MKLWAGGPDLLDNRRYWKRKLHGHVHGDELRNCIKKTGLGCRCVFGSGELTNHTDIKSRPSSIPSRKEANELDAVTNKFT